MLFVKRISPKHTDLRTDAEVSVCGRGEVRRSWYVVSGGGTGWLKQLGSAATTIPQNQVPHESLPQLPPVLPVWVLCSTALQTAAQNRRLYTEGTREGGREILPA